MIFFGNGLEWFPDPRQSLWVSVTQEFAAARGYTLLGTSAPFGYLIDTLNNFVYSGGRDGIRTYEGA